MNPEDIPLRDLHLPALTGWWPLAPGWWLLIGLALCGIGYLSWRAIQTFRRNAPRRRALSQLRRLQSEYARSRDAVSLVVSLSELLRRAMLAYAPREEVAGLTGSDWLDWLDQGLPERVFADGPGQNLGSLPYQQPGRNTDDLDSDGLIEAVRQRLKTPLTEPV